MEHLPGPLEPLHTTVITPLERRGHVSYPPAVYYGNDNGGSDPHQGGLLEYWYVIRRHKGTLILISFIGALVGFLVTLPQTPIYQAKTSMEIENMNQNFLMKDINPTQGVAAGTETSDIQTQIKILQSDFLLERVVGKLKSEQLPQTADSRISSWKKLLNLPQKAPTDAYQESISLAKSALKVRAAGTTRIIEITVDSTVPSTAATFANTLANEYIEQNLESRWKATERTTEWLTRQIDDTRIKLERSEDKLQQYARDAGLLFTNEKTSVSEDKLRQVQGSLSTAEADRIARQSRYEIAVSSPPDALPDVLNDNSLREYQTKLTDIKRQIAELSLTYQPEYSKIKRLEAQYTVIEGAFERERGAILKRIKNDYDEAVRRERLLAADYMTQARTVTGEGERGIQYNILKREVDSNRSLYDTMLQQLKQATIASALRASNVRVVDPAKVPGKPYKPDSTQNALIGLLSGLFVGAAFIVMRDRADRSIKEPGDAPTYLNVQELGVIPSSVVTSGSRLNRITAASTDERVELVTWQRKPSAQAEAFRSTLISVLFSSSQNGSRPKVLMVSSAGPAEGKSTVITNLAIAIAEVGQRVLLVDADLRKPRLHNILGVDNSLGLTDLLKERNSEAAKLLEMIKPTDVPGLFLLPSGKATNSATSLLYGSRMPQILNELRSQFDTILIDSPPMLQIPDARVLARSVDKVMLVIRAGKTTRDAAVAAMQKFKEDGTQVLGTILNDWNPKLSNNGYYGYYRKYYNDYAQYYGGSKEDKS